MILIVLDSLRTLHRYCYSSDYMVENHMPAQGVDGCILGKGDRQEQKTIF